MSFFNKIYLISILQTLTAAISIILIVAFFTLKERKYMAAIQRRKGPNVVGVWGLLQPVADGLKLFFKEFFFPVRSAVLVFLFAPILTFCLAVIQWSVIPFSGFNTIVNIEYTGLYSFAVSSLSVYGLIMAGWASNSKYAFLGALRATAQMISYEVSLGFILLIWIFLINSFNYTILILTQKYIWFFFPLFPLFFIFLIIMLAETNRTPFDLAEAEAELVAGYNVEYSAIAFALFFLGEYSNMLFMSVLIVFIFFGGWLTLISGTVFLFGFIIKILLFCFFYISIRGTLPRYRYDQLMMIGWKLILPLTIAFFLFIIGIFVFFQGLINYTSNSYLLQDAFYYLYILKSLELPLILLNQQNTIYILYDLENIFLIDSFDIL